MAERSHRKIGNRIASLRFAAFCLAFPALSFALRWVISDHRDAMMLAFDVTAFTFMLSLLPVLFDGSVDSMRQHAAENDANRSMILVISGLIIVVLLTTIASELTKPREFIAALVIATLGIAWIFANLLYTLHYAHLYYGEGHGGTGLIFPDTKTPDYWDFLYFSLTLGMTFQTSDIIVNSRRMRQVVLAQSLMAFVFNIGILAFTINTMGGV
jgi:uncharacterized membrane protein